MNMAHTTPAESVLAKAVTWPGVTTKPTPRGATAIIFDGHELGHVHTDRRTLDFPLPDDRRADVLAAGRARNWFSNWVSKRLASDADATDAIALLWESYDALRTESYQGAPAEAQSSVVVP